MSTPPEHRKTILVLTSTYPRWRGDPDPGFVHELNRRLVSRGFAVDVLTPRAPGTQDVEMMDGVHVTRYAYFHRSLEKLSYGGGILPKLRANPFLYGLVPFLMAGLTRAARNRFRTFSYDVIHAHWIIPQAFCACIARGTRKIPILVTSHGGDLFGLRATPFRWLKSWTLARSSEVAVVSHYMRDVVLEEHSVPAERVHVLPMGVDLSQRFSTSSEIERDADRIVFIGRLVAKKGVGNLIEAVRTIRARCPDVKLDIVGDGPLREALETQVKDGDMADVVCFHGALAQEHIPRFLQSATVAVVPSVVDDSGDQEGLGLVTIEAMGCGCPVVASDLPAIRDVVQHERTGLLAIPGDSLDLANMIARLLEDPKLASELAANAEAFVKLHFDWEGVADAYAKVLSSALQPR